MAAHFRTNSAPEPAPEPEPTATPDLSIPDDLDDFERPRNPWPRRILAVVGVVVAVLVVFALVLAISARGVLDRFNTAKAQAANLEQNLLNGEAEQARTQVADLTGTLTSVRSSLNGPLWSVAAHLPLIGTDVHNARTLADCAIDLSQNALTPVVDSIAGTPLNDLVQERSVNVAMLASMREAIVGAAPVIVNDASTIASLQPGVVPQLNEKLETFRTPLADASTLLQDADKLFGMVLSMLGEGGQTRTYVLLAQSNAEIRAGGGFPGSVGTIQITDGQMSLGNFQSVYEVKNLISSHGFGAAIDEGELAAFGDPLSVDAAGVTLTPNFVRAGQIAKEQWENAYGFAVDGVIAMDPIFLQRVLAITGGVTAFDGTQVTGENCAEELLHGVYMRYGFDDNGNEMEDTFFNDVAQQSFAGLLDQMGGFELDAFSQLWNAIRESGADHRFQAWMADQTQQDFLHEMGLSGEIQQDVNAPELGVYTNDHTWSKICWYLDVECDLGTPQTNEDGTTTYHATAHFRNTMGVDEAQNVPGYISGYNPAKRDSSDMIEAVYLMAPLGASITDFEVHQDQPLPNGQLLPDLECTCYGRDTWRSFIQIMAGGDTSVTFTLTMPAGVGEPTIVTSPMCQD